MSVNGLQQQYIPPTLDGLNIVEADQIYIDGTLVNLDDLVPYENATRAVDLGIYPLKTTFLAAANEDVVNKERLDISIANVINSVGANFVSKTLSSDQTMNGTLIGPVFEAYLRMTVSAPGITPWTYNARVESGGEDYVIEKDNSTNPISTILKYDVSASKWIFPDGAASKIPIWDVDKGLVSSGVDSIKISYLDNVSSDIQTQLTTKASTTYVDTQDGLRVLKAGDTMSGTLVMNGNKITTSYTPVNAEDLTRKGYVDSAISGAVSGFVLKSGDTMSNTLFNSGGNFQAYRGGDLNKSCTLYANNADGASYATHNGGLASWNGIGFYCTLDSTARHVFNTRDGSTQQTGKLTCVGMDTTDVIQSGLASNTTANIKFANSLSHIDNAAGEVYLFTGFQGHLAIGRNTTRDATTANLCLGVANTEESQIISTKTNNSGYLPLTFASSRFVFSSGNVGIGNTDPKALIHLASTTGNRKIIIYGTANDDHQFYGFGLNDNTLRYQVDQSASSHVFYCGNGAAASLELARIDGTGQLGFTGGGTGYALSSNLMTRRGAVCIGAIDVNYGGGWEAGLMLECQNTTEISCHDSGNRVTSFIYYDGGNRVYLGRDIGWGVTPYSFKGNVSIGGEADTNARLNIANPNGSYSHLGYSDNYNYIRGVATVMDTRLVIQNSTDGGPDKGIWMWNGSDSNWVIYMATAGFGRSPNSGNPVAPSGYGFGGHAIRFRVDGPNTTQGFIFENSNGGNGLLASIRSDGYTYFKGGVHTDDWFRLLNNNNGLYWENLGRGICSPEAAGNNYGTISTYGSGRNGWSGYGLGGRYALMIAGQDVGLHDNLYSWIWNCTGDATRPMRIGGGVARFSREWDRCLMYANGDNTGGGYFYYNQGNAYGTISDSRIKTDFLRITETQSVEFLRALEPTSFCLKEDEHKKKTTLVDGVEVEDVGCGVCTCRQDGWVAQNVLKACEVSGASKTAVNHWVEYEQELLKPEQERTTLIGVSDRPILSHTVNVVKHLLDRIEVLEQRNELLERQARQQEQVFLDYKTQTEDRFNKLAELIKSLK